MTDEELKSLVASLAVTQQETTLRIRELFQKSEQERIESSRRFEQERIESFRRMDALFQKSDESFEKAKEERLASSREVDKKLKELAQQIGGLGNKFGSFTEGMAFPSMQKLLTERFGMEAVTTNYRVKRHGEHLELDVFAHSNGELNSAFIVEVKSHVREEHIEQLLMQLRRLREFLPEHAGKKLYGILAGVHIPEQLKLKVYQEGLYLACIHEDNFSLQVPAGFEAKAF